MRVFLILTDTNHLLPELKKNIYHNLIIEKIVFLQYIITCL